MDDLTDVLETHCSVETNAKTHNFWAFRAFVRRLTYTAKEYGMSVEVRSEAWTSQTSGLCLNHIYGPASVGQQDANRPVTPFTARGISFMSQKILNQYSIGKVHGTIFDF